MRFFSFYGGEKFELERCKSVKTSDLEDKGGKSKKQCVGVEAPFGSNKCRETLRLTEIVVQ